MHFEKKNMCTQGSVFWLYWVKSCPHKSAQDTAFQSLAYFVLYCLHSQKYILNPSFKLLIHQQVNILPLICIRANLLLCCPASPCLRHGLAEQCCKSRLQTLDSAAANSSQKTCLLFAPVRVLAPEFANDQPQLPHQAAMIWWTFDVVASGTSRGSTAPNVLPQRTYLLLLSSE